MSFHNDTLDCFLHLFCVHGGLYVFFLIQLYKSRGNILSHLGVRVRAASAQRVA